MAYNGWHPGRAAGLEGNEASALRATGSCYEKKNKSWGRCISHLQDETTPSFLSWRIWGRTSILSVEARCRAVYWFFLQAGGFQVCVGVPALLCASGRAGTWCSGRDKHEGLNFEKQRSRVMQVTDLVSWSVRR